MKFFLPIFRLQSGPQLPQFPVSLTCRPKLLTNVEHQGVRLPSVLLSVVHSSKVIPLNLNGKMHGSFGLGPLTVLQPILSLMLPVRENT